MTYQNTDSKTWTETKTIFSRYPISQPHIPVEPVGHRSGSVALSLSLSYTHTHTYRPVEPAGHHTGSVALSLSLTHTYTC